MIYFIMALPPLLALFNTGSRSSWIGFAVSVIVITFCSIKGFCLYNIGWGNDDTFPSPVCLQPDSYHFQSRTGYFNPDQGQDFADCGTNVQTLYAVGVGLGSDIFRQLIQNYKLYTKAVPPHTHILYLQIWIEMGLPDLSLSCGILQNNKEFCYWYI